MRVLALCALALTVSGCVSVDPYRCGTLSNYCSPEPRVERPTLTDLQNLPMPRQKAVVSVYSFADQTGQRATADNMALFSTAVTQGADSFLIDALMAAGNGKWFLVAERANLDVLTRERQLIISTRNNYDGEGSNELEPLLFSGLIGLLWLGTVPLTSGIVAQVFGPRYLGTLFGIVFFSHQIGSFFGAWVGGSLYTLTSSYDLTWYISIGLGIIAAIIHLPINEKTLSRNQHS